MNIWIDADACPNPCKEVIFKCALKKRIPTFLVANSYQKLPKIPFLTLHVVKKEPDSADYFILEKAEPGDLVITQDILLADLLVKKGVLALGLRGEVFSEVSIGERLATRNLMEGLREEGKISGGPRSYSNQDKHKFSAAFDMWVQKLLS